MEATINELEKLHNHLRDTVLSLCQTNIAEPPSIIQDICRQVSVITSETVKSPHQAPKSDSAPGSAGVRTAVGGFADDSRASLKVRLRGLADADNSATTVFTDEEDEYDDDDNDDLLPCNPLLMHVGRAKRSHMVAHDVATCMVEAERKKATAKIRELELVAVAAAAGGGGSGSRMQMRGSSNMETPESCGIQPMLSESMLGLGTFSADDLQPLHRDLSGHPVRKEKDHSHAGSSSGGHVGGSGGGSGAGTPGGEGGASSGGSDPSSSSIELSARRRSSVRTLKEVRGAAAAASAQNSSSISPGQRALVDAEASPPICFAGTAIHALRQQHHPDASSNSSPQASLPHLSRKPAPSMLDIFPEQQQQQQQQQPVGSPNQNHQMKLRAIQREQDENLAGIISRLLVLVMESSAALQHLQRKTANAFEEVKVLQSSQQQQEQKQQSSSLDPSPPDSAIGPNRHVSPNVGSMRISPDTSGPSPRLLSKRPTPLALSGTGNAPPSRPGTKAAAAAAAVPSHLPQRARSHSAGSIPRASGSPFIINKNNAPFQPLSIEEEDDDEEDDFLTMTPLMVPTAKENRQKFVALSKSLIGDDDDYDDEEEEDEEEPEHHRRMLGGSSSGELKTPASLGAPSNSSFGMLSNSSSPRGGGGSGGGGGTAIVRTAKKKPYGRSNSLRPSEITTPTLRTTQCIEEIDAVSGMTFINNYLVTSLLGEGTQAPVFQAVDAADSDRVVAIKMINRPHVPPGCNSSLLRQRKQQLKLIKAEIEAMSRCRHPGLVRLEEVIDDSRNERIFLVMQFVSGGAISVSTPSGVSSRRYSARMVAHYGRQLSAALFALHDEGILHRDIKNANILLDGDGVHVKFCDFGVASILDQVEPPVEQQQTTAGVGGGTSGAGAGLTAKMSFLAHGGLLSLPMSPVSPAAQLRNFQTSAFDNARQRSSRDGYSGSMSTEYSAHGAGTTSQSEPNTPAIFMTRAGQLEAPSAVILKHGMPSFSASLEFARRQRGGGRSSSQPSPELRGASHSSHPSPLKMKGGARGGGGGGRTSGEVDVSSNFKTSTGSLGDTVEPTSKHPHQQQQQRRASVAHFAMTATGGFDTGATDDDTRGTRAFFSPELMAPFIGEGTANKLPNYFASDCWALGLSLYSCLYGCTPWSTADPADYCRRICHEDIPFPPTWMDARELRERVPLHTETDRALADLGNMSASSAASQIPRVVTPTPSPQLREQKQQQQQPSLLHPEGVEFHPEKESGESVNSISAGISSESNESSRSGSLVASKSGKHDCESKLIAVLKQMLQRDPDQRIDVETAHALLKKIDHSR